MSAMTMNRHFSLGFTMDKVGMAGAMDLVVGQRFSRNMLCKLQIPNEKLPSGHKENYPGDKAGAGGENVVNFYPGWILETPSTGG